VFAPPAICAPPNIWLPAALTPFTIPGRVLDPAGLDVSKRLQRHAADQVVEVVVPDRQDGDRVAERVGLFGIARHPVRRLVPELRAGRRDGAGPAVEDVHRAPNRRRSPNLLGNLLGNDAELTRPSPDAAG
jgi:hypothetical protein